MRHTLVRVDGASGSERVDEAHDVRVRWRRLAPAACVHLTHVAQARAAVPAHGVRPKVILDHERTLAYAIVAPFHLGLALGNLQQTAVLTTQTNSNKTTQIWH